MEWLELVASIVGGIIVLAGFGTWLVRKGMDKVFAKVETGLERLASAMDGAAIVARGAGLDKVADVIEEAADPIDEAGDVFGKLADMTASQDFTKERLVELFNEGKEVGIEGKDFFIKVFKKQ